MTEDLITVIFKVASQVIVDDYTNVDNPECSIALFGSIPELGAWKIPIMARDVRQERDGNNACFQVDTKIPSGSRFEWSWFALNKLYGPVRIETRNVRRFTVGKVPVTIHTKWNEDIEVVVPMACHVRATTKYVTKPDQVLAVSGSSTLLGKWNLDACMFAQEIDDRSSKIWQASFLVELDIYIEWRWVLVDRSTGDITWEDRANRHLLVNVDTVDMEAPWGRDCIVKASTSDFTKFYTKDVLDAAESGQMTFTLSRLVNSEMPHCPSRDRGNTRVAEMARVILLKKVWKIRPPTPGIINQGTSSGVSGVFPNYRKYNRTRITGAGLLYGDVSTSEQDKLPKHSRRHTDTKGHCSKELIVATAPGYKFGRDAHNTNIVPFAQHEPELGEPSDSNQTSIEITRKISIPTFSIQRRTSYAGSIRHISVVLDGDTKKDTSTGTSKTTELLANVPFDYIEFGEFGKVHFAVPVGRIKREGDNEENKTEEERLHKNKEEKEHKVDERNRFSQILYLIGEFLNILYAYGHY